MEGDCEEEDDDLSSHNEEIDEHDVISDAESEETDAKYNANEKYHEIFELIDNSADGAVTILAIWYVSEHYKLLVTTYPKGMKP